MNVRSFCKTIMTVAIMITAVLTVNAQSDQNVVDFRPNGSAVVVQDIERSVRWYQSVFLLKQKSRMDDPNGQYKVSILESPAMMIELMELKGSVPRNEVLNGKPEGTQVQGHFKIGFYVSDIDACLRHLNNLGVDVPRVWTDASTGKRNFLINDPDGNYIQFFD